MCVLVYINMYIYLKILCAAQKLIIDQRRPIHIKILKYEGRQFRFSLITTFIGDKRWRKKEEEFVMSEKKKGSVNFHGDQIQTQ